MTTKRVPVSLYGHQVGWAYEGEDGMIDVEITDENSMRWITEGMTTGLSIDHDKYWREHSDD